jgi:uroporphyrinogen decarboxylase
MIDQMTPIERSIALSKGQSVDRLPCNPNIANGTARIYGCKISDFNKSGKAIAQAQIASYRKFGMDGVRVFTDLYAWAETMGAKVLFPEDNTAELLKPAIDDVKDIDKIKISNPYKDGRLPVYIEAMKYLVDSIGKEVTCSGGIVGPFSNAFFLVGVEKMTKLFFTNPEEVHKLCELSLQTCIEYSKVVISLGCSITISEPLASCTIISPKFYEKFCQPYLKRLIEFIHSQGKTCVLHICGKTEKIWPYIADMSKIGVGGFSMDNIENLRKCKETLGGKMKIMGNVDPSNVMYAGTEKEVKNAVINCVLEGYDSPKGYVIMSGCSLPVETPLKNIQAMMDTVREIGYPIRPDKLGKMLL